MCSFFSVQQWGTGLLILTMLLLTGCTAMSKQKIPSAPRNIIPIAPMANELAPYKMQIGDVLEIKLLLNPELEEEVIIRPDGKISTAVAQNVPAFGLTPEELQKKLNQHYKAHLSNPNVVVIVRTFAPTRVYVLGEVTSPGEYISIGPNLTLLQALARAGGIKNSAKTNEILLLRRGSAEHPKAYYANYDAAISGLDPGADIRLAAYDVVYVPRLAIAEAYVRYEQYFQQFLRFSVGLGLGYSLN